MKSRKTILLTSLIIVIGLLLGFTIQKLFFESSKSIMSSLPLPAEVIEHQVIEKLSANVEGAVVEKGKDTMILEKDNRRVTIHIEESVNISTFDKEISGKFEHIHFADIKEGDYVRGGVAIVVSPESAVGFIKNYKPGDIIGHNFTLL